WPSLASPRVESAISEEPVSDIPLGLKLPGEVESGVVYFIERYLDSVKVIIDSHRSPPEIPDFSHERCDRIRRFELFGDRGLHLGLLGRGDVVLDILDLIVDVRVAGRGSSGHDDNDTGAGAGDKCRSDEVMK
ncbi:unnamed protein product, partial [Rhizoctonia solani]